MTAQTRSDTDTSLAGYAEPSHLALFRAAAIEDLPLGENALSLGPLTISTGRSGHVAGGVWCRVDDGGRRFVYCGDVTPASAVFAMDAMPACDAMAIDASYGDDTIDGEARAQEVREWIVAHARRMRVADTIARAFRGASRHRPRTDRSRARHA